MTKKVNFAITIGALFLLGLGGLSSVFVLTLEGGAFFSSPSSFVDGSGIKEIESQFDKNLPFRTSLLNKWNRGLFILFRQGLPGVLVGKDDWLFTSEEWYSEPPGSQGAWNVISETHQNLENQGIELFVVVIPAKNRVASEFVPRPLFSPLENRYARSLERLQELGIPHLDLLTPYLDASKPSDVFLRTDTHWTPEGARLAAREIAKTLGQQLPGLNLGDWIYTTQVGDREPFRGDLFEFLPSGDGPLLTSALPRPDTLTTYRTTQAQGPSVGLFDLPQIPIALVGTSYSAGERWNFLGFLQEAMGSDIVSFAQEGEGPFVPMKEALENPGLQEAGVKLVLWEIPERYLPF
ncbi:MAG: hypothetical protein GW949_05325 [Spirochaetales bacterium]|nr:hypothetical protein [Spirochaetales bacterium]